jgi:sugar lactone lactonase YvrE
MKKTILRQLIVAIGGLITLLSAGNLLAAAGDLYVANSNGGNILKVNSGLKTVFASGLTDPTSVAFDGSGNLFVADASTHMIFKFAPNGTRSTFASNLGVLFALAFDASGNLFAVDEASGTIFKFTPEGAQSTFVSGIGSPVSLAFDAAGNLFVGDQVANAIFKFAPDGTKTTFASGLNDPLGLAFDSTGNLFVAENVGGTIFKFTPNGAMTTFATNLNGPAGLAFDSSGNLFEADTNSSTIFEFTSTGTKTTFASGFAQPLGIAFEPTLHQLLNISTRGFVGTGDAVLIGGFIVGGNGMVNGKVLIRAAGPSLTAQNVSGALQDPVLRLFNSSGTVIATNDNWKDTQQAQIQATGLAPTDDHESAILATLPAGAFTAIITGAGNSTGIARVDVFNVQ